MPAIADTARPGLLAAPLAALEDKNPVAFAALFASIAVAFAVVTEHLPDIPRWALCAAMPLGVLLGGTAGRVFLAIGAGCLLWALGEEWFAMANHGFVIAYFAVFLALVPPGRRDFWSEGVVFARAIMMLLMGVALLQKVTSGYYLSGNQFADMLLGGESYLALLSFLDSSVPGTVSASIMAERALEADFARQAAGGSAALPEPGLILLIAIYGMTWASILFQAGLELALVWHQRCGIWLHRVIFCFTLVVYTLRPENIFLSMNLLMGYALTDGRSRSMRLPYAIAIVLLLVGAVTGFRPAFLY